MDVKVMADPSTVFQLNTLGWARGFSQTFTAVLGMGLLLGSKITKMSLAANGPHGHTTLTHVVSVFQNLLIGLFPSDVTMWLSGILGFVGDQKSHGVAQMVGLAAGQCKGKDGKPKFGSGELSGLQANMRALGVVFGPFIYSFAYTRGVSMGLPGAAFIACAMLSMLAEFLHRPLVGKFGK